jgi:hypothetical protein
VTLLSHDRPGFVSPARQTTALHCASVQMLAPKLALQLLSALSQVATMPAFQQMVDREESTCVMPGGQLATLVGPGTP